MQAPYACLPAMADYPHEVIGGPPIEREADHFIRWLDCRDLGDCWRMRTGAAATITPTDARTSALMKSAIAILLLFSPLLGCTGPGQGRTTEMNPDCTQVSAEEQAKGNCMYRPEVPEAPPS
jgi:hypothetical protein